MRESEDLWRNVRQPQAPTGRQRSVRSEVPFLRRLSRRTSSLFARGTGTATINNDDNCGSAQASPDRIPAKKPRTLPFQSVLPHIEAYLDDGSSIADYESVRDEAGQVVREITEPTPTRNLAWARIHEHSPEGGVTPPANSIADSLPPASTVSSKGEFDSRMQRSPVEGIYLGYPLHMKQLERRNVAWSEDRGNNEGTTGITTTVGEPALVRVNETSAESLCKESDSKRPPKSLGKALASAKQDWADTDSELCSLHWKNSVGQLEKPTGKNWADSDSEMSSIHWMKSIGQIQAIGEPNQADSENEKSSIHCRQPAGCVQMVVRQTHLFMHESANYVVYQYGDAGNVEVRIPLASTSRTPTTWANGRPLPEGVLKDPSVIDVRKRIPSDLSFSSSTRDLAGDGGELSDPFLDSPSPPEQLLVGPQSIRPVGLRSNSCAPSSVANDLSCYGPVREERSPPASAATRSRSDSTETVVWKPASDFFSPESEAEITQAANAAFFLPPASLPTYLPIATLVQDVEQERDQLAAENGALKAAMQGTVLQMRESANAYDALQTRTQAELQALRAHLEGRNTEIARLWEMLRQRDEENELLRSAVMQLGGSIEGGWKSGPTM